MSEYDSLSLGAELQAAQVCALSHGSEPKQVAQIRPGQTVDLTILPPTHYQIHPLMLALLGISIPTAAVVPASTGRITPVIHRA